MSRKSSRLCRILFTALLAALILVVVPYAKVKADDEGDRLIDFDISFDGAQSYAEYDVYYAFNPEVVSDGAISYTQVEGVFANGKTNGYYHDSGEGWSSYGAKFVIDEVTWGYEPKDDDTLYIKVVTKATDSKPAKTIMYGNARGWDNDMQVFHEKQLIGDEKDTANYSFNEKSASMSSCTYEITAKLKDFKTYTALNFGLAYPRQGDTRAKKYIEDDIFAYGDIDASGSVDENDIRKGIAVDLCRKYFWEEGGILSEYYEIRHPNDILESKKLYSDENRLTVTGNGTVSAYDKDGTAQSIKKYNYSLELGYDCDGKLITVTGDAYGLDSTEQVLIQEDDKLFIRDVVRGEGDNRGDEVDFGNYGETPAVCVVVDDFNNIKFGGNGVSTNYDRTYNPDGSTVLCVFMQNEDFACKYNDTFGAGGTQFSTWPSDRSSNLRIIGKNNRYAIVEPCEGYKRAEGIQKDPVCMTGDNAYVETFAGYKELKITSLSSELGCTPSQQIKDIKLVNRSMSKGVQITPINDGETRVGYKVTFKSNFYDEVPIEITYEDNVTQTLTIKRIALVVRYEYLGDPDVMPESKFCFEFEKDMSKVEYDYDAGEQIIIYAQYYHTENDNSDLTLFLNKGGNAGVEIINKDLGDRRTNHVYRKDATEECVAETFFLLGFAPAHNEENRSIDSQNVGAWDAMVLNAGYDGSSSFGGAQFGSGTGFHWDGEISWQY